MSGPPHPPAPKSRTAPRASALSLACVSLPLGRGGTVFVPPYQLLLDREMEFLNKSAHAAHLVERLSASRHPGEARLLEQNLEGNWTQYAVSHGWERELWGKVLYSLKGLYRPVLMTWVDRFVVPGRPLLVIQSEGFFHSAPEVVDSVMGPFLFGAGRAPEGTRGGREGAF